MDTKKDIESPAKRTYFLDFMGQSTLHRVYSNSMSRWTVGGIKYQCKPLFCALTIDQDGIGAVKEEKLLINLNIDASTSDSMPNGTITNGNNATNNKSGLTTVSAFSHPLAPIDAVECETVLCDPSSEDLPLKIPFDHILEINGPTDYEKECVSFVVDNGIETPLTCLVFKEADSSLVKEVGDTIKKFISWHEKVSPSRCSHMISRNVKLEDLDSIRFEVMFLGKLQVKNEYPNPLHFIDEAVDKYHALEMEHAAAMQDLEIVDKLAKESSDSSKVTSVNSDQSEKVLQNLIDGSREGAVEILRRNSTAVWNTERRASLEEVRSRCNSMDIGSIAAMRRRSKGRIRHCSEPSTAATMGFDKNKTRLLQVGRQSITLICPDQSTRTVEIQYTNITRCSKGVKYKEHFGVFAKDASCHFNPHSNVKEDIKFKCYLFKCSDECVCEEIMQAMKQACNMCVHGPDPMKTFHALCKRINTTSGNSKELTWIERAMNLAAKCITESFNDSDQKKAKLKIEESHKKHPPGSKYERLVVVMETVRLMFEEKQHEHDIKAKQLRDPQSSNAVSKKLSFIKSRAKKSLTSIESFWGKGIQKMQELQHEAEHHIQSPVEKLRFFTDNPHSAPTTPVSNQIVTAHSSQSARSRHRSGSPASFTDISPLAGSNGTKNIVLPEPIRPRSNTVGATEQGSINVRRKLNLTDDSSNQTPTTSVLKPSNPSVRSLSSESTPVQSRSSTPLKDDSSPDRGTTMSGKKQTFHQQIFNRIITPAKTKIKESKEFESPQLKDYMRPRSPMTTPDQIRLAWQRAIQDQIILNKIMKISTNNEVNGVNVSTPVSVKLNYSEPDVCQPAMDTVWQELLETDDRCRYKMDSNVLRAAVKKGVPKNIRGKVWSLLYEQWKLRQDDSRSPLCSFKLDKAPYEDLLKKLTPHQHAILIDLGRTFPSHPYFSQQLGSGQLALYNVLKAYSLVDDEVGYCQGLSFVTGLLLMHMSSANEAFDMLCHVMTGIGCRNLYLPDMAALQVAVYKLSRLLYDFHKDLHVHLENNDVTLMLFSASWFLTMFSSVLSFGFTARIFDLLFLEGTSALFKAALCLLSHHKDKIIQEDGFEGIVGYLKNNLPNMCDADVKEVLAEIFDLDIAEKLRIYEVEYAVLEDGDIFGSDQEDVSPDGPKELEQKYSRLEQAHQTVTKYNVELVEQLEAARMQISSLQQGLTDMAALDEKRTLEFEAIKQENELLKHKQ